MGIPDARWHEVSASPYEHERRAIAWLRDRLPDHEPWRAWSNFEFVAHDGSHNEVDLLVLGRTGVFLIEIKSHPGVVSGDQRLLEVSDPASPDRSRQLEHPIHIANRKAKRLKTILERTAAFGGGGTGRPSFRRSCSWPRPRGWMWKAPPPPGCSCGMPTGTPPPRSRCRSLPVRMNPMPPPTGTTRGSSRH